MNLKPKIGILGFSDGEPEVHEDLKEIVQAQLDAIANALEKSGEVEVIRAARLVNSVKTAKEEAEKLARQGWMERFFPMGYSVSRIFP